MESFWVSIRQKFPPETLGDFCEAILPSRRVMRCSVVVPDVISFTATWLSGRLQLGGSSQLESG